MLGHEKNVEQRGPGIPVAFAHFLDTKDGHTPHQDGESSLHVGSTIQYTRRDLRMQLLATVAIVRRYHLPQILKLKPCDVGGVRAAASQQAPT